MQPTWQLQEAQGRLSDVIEDTLQGYPQIIIERGVETAVVLSYTEYRRLLINQTKCSDFFRQSLLVDIDLDLTRDQSALRNHSEPSLDREQTQRPYGLCAGLFTVPDDFDAPIE